MRSARAAAPSTRVREGLAGLTLTTAIVVGWPGSTPAQAPSTAANIAFEAGATTTGWMPIELFRDRYVYVAGSVNGRETSILVDSGAGLTCVDAGFARELGLTLDRAVTASGVGGRTQAHLAAGVAIALGRTVLKPARVVVIDLEDVTARLGRTMPVILGADVFAAAVVDLDYPQSRLALHEARGYHYTGPGRALPLVRVTDRRFQVEGQVEGRPVARFDLDTGSADTVILFKAYADTERLLEARSPVSTRQITGVGGSAVATIATLSSFTIAGHELRGVPATFAPDREGVLASRRSAGLIGAGLLRRFRAVIDAGRNTLYLEAGAGLRVPFEKDHSGLHVEYSQGMLQVTHVAAASPAARAGWRAGESVRAVNGQPVGADYWSWWQSAVTAASGTALTLRDGRGRDRTLVLAKYY